MQRFCIQQSFVSLSYRMVFNGSQHKYALWCQITGTEEGNSHSSAHSVALKNVSLDELI